MIKNNFFVLYLILLLIITGCTKIHNHSSKKKFPKKEPRKERVYFTYGLKSRQAEESGDIYIVKEGDSLSSISFLYDVSYKKIAKWNNIDKLYIKLKKLGSPGGKIIGAGGGGFFMMAVPDNVSNYINKIKDLFLSNLSIITILLFIFNSIFTSFSYVIISKFITNG